MKAPSVDRIRALEALLRTRSPTSAAAELHVARATAKRTLEEWRAELNDQLLMRRGNQLILTRRAESLVSTLGEALGTLDRLLEGEPEQAERANAAISMRDEFVLTLAPALLKRLATDHPQTTLKILPYEHHAPIEDLDRRIVDLAVVVDPPRSSEIVTKLLYTEPFVCVTADRAPLTPERYLSAAHVAMTSYGANAAVDAALARHGYKRHIAVYVPHLTALLQAVESDGLYATLPIRPLLAMRPAKLFVHPAPIPIPERSVLLAWNRKCERDPKNRWLRNLVLSVSQP
jgi:DNA-binding transcriptional LysR family regulator